MLYFLSHSHVGRREKEKSNILKLSLGHQESSGLMGTVIAEMPGKTISDLSAPPKRAKSIKHLSSCVGSKNNYSVIYYYEKASFQPKCLKKKSIQILCVCGCRRILVGWFKWVPVCVCKCHNTSNKQGSEESEFSCIWFTAWLYFGTTNWAKAFTKTHPRLGKVQPCIQSLLPCLLLS